MNQSVGNIVHNTTDKLIDYLPNLTAGLLLVAIGWLLAWLSKRVVMQICFALRLDRLLRRTAWGAGLARADLRFALYESFGNLAFLVVLLIFMHTSLEILQLPALSNLLAKGVAFIPRILIAGMILILGWLTAAGIASSVQKALAREGLPRATLISRFLKAVMLLFVMAMALAEVNVAREIVVIGFTTSMITLGVVSVVLTILGGKKLLDKILDSLE